MFLHSWLTCSTIHQVGDAVPAWRCIAGQNAHKPPALPASLAEHLQELRDDIPPAGYGLVQGLVLMRRIEGDPRWASWRRGPDMRPGML